MQQQHSRSGYQAHANTWATAPAWSQAPSISEVQWPPALSVVPRPDFARAPAARTAVAGARWQSWFLGLTLAFSGGFFARPFLETEVLTRAGEFSGHARVVWSFVVGSLPAWMRLESAPRELAPVVPAAAPAPKIRPIEAAPEVRAAAPVEEPAPVPVAAPLAAPSAATAHARVRVSAPAAHVEPKGARRVVDNVPAASSAAAVATPVAEEPVVAPEAPAPDSIDGLIARALTEPAVGKESASAAARLRFPGSAARPRRKSVSLASAVSKPEHVALPEPEPQAAAPKAVPRAGSSSRIRALRNVKVSDDPLAGVVSRSIEGQRVSPAKGSTR